MLKQLKQLKLETCNVRYLLMAKPIPIKGFLAKILMACGMKGKFQDLEKSTILGGFLTYQKAGRN